MAIGDFAFIDRAVAHYMIHDSNYSNNPNPMLQIRDIEMIKLVENYFESVGKLNEFEKKQIIRLKRFIYRKYHSMLVKNLLFYHLAKPEWYQYFNLKYFLMDYIIKGIKVKIFKIGSI